MAKKTQDKKVEIQVKPIQTAKIKLAIKGMKGSNLLMHKFSDTQKQEMLDKQLKKTKERKARDVSKEVKEAIHYTSTGKVGFPTSGFKKAMVEVAPYLGSKTEMNKKLAKGAFQILGDLVPIKFKHQKINEAVVRLASGVSMVRYRPEFTDWSCELEIMYNASQISAQQIVNLAKLAGFHVGVGDWRPQCSGSFGMFEVK